MLEVDAPYSPKVFEEPDLYPSLFVGEALELNWVEEIPVSGTAAPDSWLLLLVEALEPPNPVAEPEAWIPPEAADVLPEVPVMPVEVPVMPAEVPVMPPGEDKSSIPDDEFISSLPAALVLVSAAELAVLLLSGEEDESPPPSDVEALLFVEMPSRLEADEENPAEPRVPKWLEEFAVLSLPVVPKDEPIMRLVCWWASPSAKSFRLKRPSSLSEGVKFRPTARRPNAINTAIARWIIVVESEEGDVV
jgi:hypothetical protein